MKKTDIVPTLNNIISLRAKARRLYEKSGKAAHDRLLCGNSYTIDPVYRPGKKQERALCAMHRATAKADALTCRLGVKDGFWRPIKTASQLIEHWHCYNIQEGLGVKVPRLF